MSQLRSLSVVILLASQAIADEARPRALPAFTLSDPLERVFTNASLAERGAILVVTAPTHSQGDAQYAWSAALRSLSVAPDGPMRVLVEDMSQSWFRPVVMAKIKASYGPRALIVLLLDEGGRTRKALGVPGDTTLAFAIAPGGSIVAVETGIGTPERARRLLEAIHAGGKVQQAR